MRESVSRACARLLSPFLVSLVENGRVHVAPRDGVTQIITHLCDVQCGIYKSLDKSVHLVFVTGCTDSTPLHSQSTHSQLNSVAPTPSPKCKIRTCALPSENGRDRISLFFLLVVSRPRWLSALLLLSLLFPFPPPLVAVLLVARPPAHEHSGRARRRASACRVRRGGGTGSKAKCAHKWFYFGHEEALFLLPPPAIANCSTGVLHADELVEAIVECLVTKPGDLKLTKMEGKAAVQELAAKDPEVVKQVLDHEKLADNAVLKKEFASYSGKGISRSDRCLHACSPAPAHARATRCPPHPAHRLRQRARGGPAAAWGWGLREAGHKESGASWW